VESFHHAAWWHGGMQFVDCDDHHEPFEKATDHHEPFEKATLPKLCHGLWLPTGIQTKK
jgi:hypothetical protein